MHAKHSAELGAIVQQTLARAGPRLGVTSRQLGKFESLWSEYERTLVPARNRVVHDAYVFGLTGQDAGLARIVTGANRDGTPVPTSLGAVQELANNFAMTQWMVFRVLATLEAMADGSFTPPLAD